MTDRDKPTEIAAACVIYARVSSKEQQEEGFSIPAQLKADRAFCEKEGLVPVAEFIEAESAGKAGRRRFGAMLEFFREHPEVRLVVAHKLDRLYRNFTDQVRLEEELGVRARYVVGDMPDSPQGQLLRDVQLSVAKFYLGNLQEEVKKGLAEKASQGGWVCHAPLGYVNDRDTRTILPDPLRAPLVRHAFERYATGVVSLSDLANELHAMGLSHVRSGHKVYASSLHWVLRNPAYCGLVRYKETIYPGKHEALISLDLFQRVQQRFEPNRRGNKEQNHVFALRDFLTCAECGCKITAERQKGYVYYRCTHGKGREVCTERAYTREEKLLEQVEGILASIEIGPDILEALVQESRLLDEAEAGGCEAEREGLERAIAENRAKTDRLLDSYLENLLDKDGYQRKARELGEERLALERRVQATDSAQENGRTARIETVLQTAGSARTRFLEASTEGRRELLSTVLLNATLHRQEIQDFQLKSPYDALQMDADGALIRDRWGILDLNAIRSRL
jgi:site-specific DNA recombinase